MCWYILFYVEIVFLYVVFRGYYGLMCYLIVWLINRVNDENFVGDLFRFCVNYYCDIIYENDDILYFNLVDKC